VPSSTAIISIIIALATVNVCDRNVRRSSSARSERCSTSCRATNATRPTTPTTNAPHSIAGEVPPVEWPTLLRP
jgi:hypothetical protein